MRFCKDSNDIFSAYRKKLISEAAPTMSARPAPAKLPPTPQGKESTEQILKKAEPIVNDLNNDEEWDLDDIAQYSPGEAAIAKYLGTDLPEWGFKDLEPLISRSYKENEPILIYGDPGVGKSSTVEYFAEHVAAPSKNRIYKDWRKCSIEEKNELIAHPEKYFVFIVELVNKLEPSDLMGVPDISSSKQYLETKQLKWIYLMSRPNAAGILFLDEINLGSPQILESLYEVVLDKSAAGTKFSDEFAVMAAGNIAGEFTQNVQPLPRALIDRFKSGVLVAKPEEWLEYAENAGVDRRIIAFVKSDTKNNFYTRPSGESDPYVTPRSLMKLSKMMKSIYKEYGELIKQNKPLPMPIYRAIGLEAAKLGTTWANRFITFLQHIKAFDIKALKTGAMDINKKEQSELMALTVFLVNRVKATTKKEYKDNPPQPAAGGTYVIKDPQTFEVLDALVHILAHLNKDSSMTLFSYIKRDLSLEEQLIVTEFIQKGNYDSNIKKLVLQKIGNLTKIAKGNV